MFDNDHPRLERWRVPDISFRAYGRSPLIVPLTAMERQRSIHRDLGVGGDLLDACKA